MFKRKVKGGEVYSHRKAHIFIHTYKFRDYFSGRMVKKVATTDASGEEDYRTMVLGDLLLVFVRILFFNKLKPDFI